MRPPAIPSAVGGSAVASSVSVSNSIPRSSSSGSLPVARPQTPLPIVAFVEARQAGVQDHLRGETRLDIAGEDRAVADLRRDDFIDGQAAGAGGDGCLDRPGWRRSLPCRSPCCRTPPYPHRTRRKSPASPNP